MELLAVAVAVAGVAFLLWKRKQKKDADKVVGGVASKPVAKPAPEKPAAKKPRAPGKPKAGSGGGK